MAKNLLNKLATILMATTIAFTPITAGCESCATPDNNNDPGIENVGGNGNENPGNENPTPEQHSQLLNAVLNNQYYKNAINAAAGVQDVANKNKYKPIPYKYLEDKGYNVNKILNNELRCESDVFLYNNELYIALKTEVEANTNYFDCQILKYQISEQEIEELNKMYGNFFVANHRGVYVQGPFMVQHISYLREPVELLDTPAKITPEAMKLCTTNINNKHYFANGKTTKVIYIANEKFADDFYKYSFMIFNDYTSNLMKTINTSELGIVGFASQFNRSINNVYNNTNYNITEYFLDDYKTEFEQSIINVTMYNSEGAQVFDHNDHCNIVNKNLHL